MEALEIREVAPCECGGHPRIFGPCEFAPRSHWGIYCGNPQCEKMATGASLEDAIDHWNHGRIHPRP